jgi:hypothetical protein
MSAAVQTTVAVPPMDIPVKKRPPIRCMIVKPYRFLPFLTLLEVARSLTVADDHLLLLACLMKELALGFNTLTLACLREGMATIQHRCNQPPRGLLLLLR